MNITCGFYFSAILILIIAQLKILQFPVVRIILFFTLTVVIFFIQDYLFIKMGRYRIAIDRFSNTPKFLKIIYGLIGLIFMLSNFFVILFAAGFSSK